MKLWSNPLVCISFFLTCIFGHLNASNQIGIFFGCKCPAAYTLTNVISLFILHLTVDVKLCPAIKKSSVQGSAKMRAIFPDFLDLLENRVH